jgi:copper(I)-binding protein
MTAGYLTLSNNSAQAITITHVTSNEYASVEMHESVIEDGVARMYPLRDLTLPAGKSVTFEPGGKHLMLMRPGDDNDFVTLEFYAGESAVLTIDVALTE